MRVAAGLPRLGRPTAPGCAACLCSVRSASGALLSPAMAAVQPTDNPLLRQSSKTDRHSATVADQTKEKDARITAVGMGDADGDGLIAAQVLDGKGNAELIERWTECRWDEWRESGAPAVWYHVNFAKPVAIAWLRGAGPNDARIGEDNA